MYLQANKKMCGFDLRWSTSPRHGRDEIRDASSRVDNLAPENIPGDRDRKWLKSLDV